MRAASRSVSCRERCSPSSASCSPWSDHGSRPVRNASSPSSCRRRTRSARPIEAQLLPEPLRTTSLELLKEYNDLAILLAHQVPFTDTFDATAAAFDPLQRELWAATGEAVDPDPTGTGPRTYVETMNEMIDTHTERMASLRNRVPTPVMLLLVVGSGLTLGMLAAYLAILGRSIITSLIAADGGDRHLVRFVRPRPAGARLHHGAVHPSSRPARRWIYRQQPDLEPSPEASVEVAPSVQHKIAIAPTVNRMLNRDGLSGRANRGQSKPNRTTGRFP